MKNFRNLKYLKLATLSIALISYSFMISCSGDDGGDTPDPADPQAEALQKLTGGAWAVSSITRNGTDVTSDFSGFTISFTSTGFTTTNGTGAWESSGTWSWNDPQGSSIILDNGIIVNLAFSNNDTTLTVSFTVPETIFDIGRSKSLAGSYVFVLNK